MKEKYILIDSKVAQNIASEISHLSEQWIPKEILTMKFMNKIGKEQTVEQIYLNQHKRLNTLKEYLLMGLDDGYLEKDVWQKIRELKEKSR